MTDEVNSCVQNPERIETIARLNDCLRQHATGGIVVVTRGVRSLPGFSVPTLLTMLKEYEDFDEDNDPHGERDFGDLEFDGQDLLWKIEYYDANGLHGSPDPADTRVTQRVLTVMLATEW